MDLLWCDDVMGRSPPGNAGVSPARFLAQTRPSRPLGSTGNGVLTLLRLGRCGSRGQAACRTAGKPSGTQRERMRAGRPRSRVVSSRWCSGVIQRATSLKAGLNPLGSSRLPASLAPPCRADHTRMKQPIANEDEPRINTNRHGDRWTAFNHKRYPNASAILSLWYYFLSFVDNPLEIGCHPTQLTTHHSAYWCSFVSIRGSSFPLVDIFSP